MDVIFSKLRFDDKKDLKRIEEIAKEVEQRVKRIPGYSYGKCDRCGYNRSGFARVVDGQFICVRCLIKDEVERRLNEAPLVSPAK